MEIRRRHTGRLILPAISLKQHRNRGRHLITGSRRHTSRRYSRRRTGRTHSQPDRAQIRRGRNQDLRRNKDVRRHSTPISRTWRRIYAEANNAVGRNHNRLPAIIAPVPHNRFGEVIDAPTGVYPTHRAARRTVPICQRGEKLDTRTADHGRRGSWFGHRADHPQRIFVGLDKPVGNSSRWQACDPRGPAAYMTRWRLGNESHCSSRDVKYQPPRS
ncbi:hypothetical protein MYIN104542_14730 [Mycobacterium intermedium]